MNIVNKRVKIIYAVISGMEVQYYANKKVALKRMAEIDKKNKPPEHNDQRQFYIYMSAPPSSLIEIPVIVGTLPGDIDNE